MSAIAAWAARHAKAVLFISVLAALAAGLAATRLPTDAGTGTLVDSDAESYLATQQVREAFGEEPVVVLARGELPQLLLTNDIFRLLRLEGCLSGRVPDGVEPIPGPCAELARMQPVELLSGPATFLNEATIQVQRQLPKGIQPIMIDAAPFLRRIVIGRGQKRADDLKVRVVSQLFWV